MAQYIDEKSTHAFVIEGFLALTRPVEIDPHAHVRDVTHENDGIALVNKYLVKLRENPTVIDLNKHGLKPQDSSHDFKGGAWLTLTEIDLTGLDLSFKQAPFDFSGVTKLDGANLVNADLRHAKDLGVVESYEGLILHRSTKLPADAPEWLKQLHEVAKSTPPGATTQNGYATWKDGKAQACDADGKVLPASPAKDTGVGAAAPAATPVLAKA